MVNEILEITDLIEKYSNDSKYSKRCFVNQINILMHNLIVDIYNDMEKNLDEPSLKIIDSNQKK